MAARTHVDEMFETYMLSLAGVDQCPDSALPSVKNRLEANVERAEQAFADAVADGLNGDSSVIVDAVYRLAKANEASRAGFHDGKSINDLLDALELATEHARALLRTSRAPPDSEAYSARR